MGRGQGVSEVPHRGAQPGPGGSGEDCCGHGHSKVHRWSLLTCLRVCLCVCVFVCLCVQVLQQEEQADKDRALGGGAPPGGPRPRQLKQRWREAVEEAADGSLPQRAEFTAGELDGYLGRLRARVVEDLGAANRNVVSIYPEDYRAFQVRRQPGNQVQLLQTFFVLV